jgi:hypothetical protein
MHEVKLLSFQDAISDSDRYTCRHLLLGNGFSIACIPSIFTYTSLYEQADFSDIPEVEKLFELLNTKDFELVINCLENGSLAIPLYLNQSSDVESKMRMHAKRLKELLIETVAKNHPAYPSEIDTAKYESCINFLKIFLDKKGRIYSFNYDLLLYWTVMYGMEKRLIATIPIDGFGRDTDFFDGESHASEYLTWQGESTASDQNIHYLHGALHLYDRGADIEKFTWRDKNVRLIDQAREALSQGRFPLFVSEGESEKKMKKITHSGYLYHSYKSFSKIMAVGKRGTINCLFVYGLSFTENDSHILDKISAGRVKHMYVSIYGDPNSNNNQKIIQAAELLKRKRKEGDLEISYFDAESATVWG